MSLEKYPHQLFRWHKRGITPILKVTKERSGTTFYGELSLKTKKEILRCVDNQNPDSQGMIIFLNLIKKRYQGKGKVLLVLDNASFHKSKEIKDWLTQHPNVVELFNFPPYPPMLNPQEHVWKALRAHFSKKLTTYTWKELLDRACRYLLAIKFDYKFCDEQVP